MERNNPNKLKRYIESYWECKTVERDIPTRYAGGGSTACNLILYDIPAVDIKMQNILPALGLADVLNAAA